MKWFDVKNKGKVGEIYMYGDITDDKWYDTDVTPMDVAAQLKELDGVESVNLYMNSGGGGVYAGVAIYNALKRFDKPITAYIDGLAASIASLIVLAADTVVMPSNAMFMIHNPYLWGTSGDAGSLRETADRLDKVKDIIIDTYMQKTSLTADELGKMMDEETWMDGNEALAFGFTDTVDESQKIAASFSGENVRFKNVEVNIKKFRSFPTDKVTPEKAEETENNTEFEIQQQRHRHINNMLSAQP